MVKKGMCKCTKELPNGGRQNFGQYMVENTKRKIELRCCSCNKPVESAVNFHRRKADEKRKEIEAERAKLEAEEEKVEKEKNEAIKNDTYARKNR